MEPNQESADTSMKQNPAILLPHAHPEELKAGSQGDICTPMFTAAPFTEPRGKNNSRAIDE